MESAPHEPGRADRVHPKGNGNLLASVPGEESRVHLELAGQFGSVFEFADFCRFLTSDRVGDQAGQLASFAQALYEETTADLRRSRPRG
jgi:hypothetical protein